MKVDTWNINFSSIKRPQSVASVSNSSSSFSAILSSATKGTDQTAKAGDAEPDFTNMTRKDLFDWMNSKISSGEMSLDDSSAFLGMTIRIPVGASNGTAMALDDRERVNFVQIAQDGIAGALSQNSETTRKMLETAMRTMQGY